MFEGGFGLEAAEAVIDLGEWADAPWPMDALQVLVDPSLVRAGVHAEDTRFTLPRSIRDYATEKLEESGGAGAARDRHAAEAKLVEARALAGGIGVRAGSEVAEAIAGLEAWLR